MLFCPNCGNILLLDKASTTKYICATCPYQYELNGQAIYNVNDVTKAMKVQELADEQQLADGQKIREECPKCGHQTAYCIMFQTRSSDEPMTRFFMCESCRHRWKNDQ